MLLRSLIQIWKSNKHWIWHDVIIPLVITRFALILVGWFSQYLPPNSEYPLKEVVARGWHFSPHRLLDIWGRWDTAWYMIIINNGYSVGGDIQTTKSSLAFFPLYPYLVKLLVRFIPAQLLTPGIMLLVGVVVSNIFLLGALVLLYKLVMSSFNDESIARRSVLYLLLFPTSFFFSCFYTESAFLFLSVATFFAASKRAWGIASVLGGLLALTRPVGVLIIIPLIWMYLEELRWNLRKIRWHLAWFLLVPIGLLVFLLSVYHLTGNLLALFQAQAAWGRLPATPWETLINPKYYRPYVTPLEQVFIVGFILLGFASVVLLRSKSYSIYSFLLLTPPLLTGQLVSVLRFCAVVFPVFIVMALLGKWQTIDRFVTISFLALQVLLMAYWSQFYFIG